MGVGVGVGLVVVVVVVVVDKVATVWVGYRPVLSHWMPLSSAASAVAAGAVDFGLFGRGLLLLLFVYMLVVGCCFVCELEDSCRLASLFTIKSATPASAIFTGCVLRLASNDAADCGR